MQHIQTNHLMVIFVVCSATGFAAAITAILLVRRQITGELAELSLHVDQLQCNWTFHRPYDREAMPAKCRDPISTQPGSAQSKVDLPAIIFSRQTFHQLTVLLRRDLDETPGVETGCALVGRIVESEKGRQIIINGLIEAGPSNKPSPLLRDRSPSHVRFDRAYQQQRLERVQLIERRCSHLGDAHTHPGSLDRCSHGDLTTDLANVRASATQEMVFVIATELRFHRKNPGFSKMSQQALGLKLDTFYLGSASDYRYQHVPITLDDQQPHMAVPPLLDRLADTNPERFALDWNCLRTLSDWELRFAKINLDDIERQCLELLHRREPRRIVLAFTDDSVPLVFVDEGGAISEYQPAFLRSDCAGRIWLTEIVLSAERDLCRPMPGAAAPIVQS